MSLWISSLSIKEVVSWSTAAAAAEINAIIINDNFFVMQRLQARQVQHVMFSIKKCIADIAKDLSASAAQIGNSLSKSLKMRKTV